MIQRLERGEVRAATLADYEDTPGARGSNDPLPNPSVKVMRAIKVEVDEDEEENKVQRFIMTMLAAISLSILTQWLFGKCSRRNKPMKEIPSEETAEPAE